MPLKMVQNQQAGPTVLSSDPKGTEYVEWQGKGDANGEDIQPVSDLIQGTPAYRKAVRRGILLELDDDAQEMIDAAEAQQQAAWEKRQNASAEVAAENIDQVQNNDIISVPCMGPGHNPDDLNGQVQMKQKDLADRPPLCDRHRDLRSQFIPEQDLVNGKPATRWVRFVMGERQVGEA